MKTAATAVVVAVCVYLTWFFIVPRFETTTSGTTTYSGLATKDTPRIKKFLTSQGFVPEPVLTRSNGTLQVEIFRGTFHGSRPFTVKIAPEPLDTNFITVETSFKFHGFSWMAPPSDGKANEFMQALNNCIADFQTQISNDSKHTH